MYFSNNFDLLFSLFEPSFFNFEGYTSNSGPITITVEGLEASSEYETILYQYGGELRNTDGLLTLNNGTTVKVGVLYLKIISMSQSFIYH